MKKVILYLGLFALLIGMVGCSSSQTSSSDDTLEALKKKGVVYVGFANEKPYAYEENGELKGEAVDIAKEIFKQLGIEKVEGRLAEFNELIPGLNAGKFDVITAGMAILPNRCEKVDFAEPEYQVGDALVVKKGNPKNLHSYEDIAKLPDVKIAVMSSAMEVDYLKQSGVREEQIVLVPDIPAVIDAVKTGRADAATGTQLTMKEALQSAGQKELELVSDFKQPDVEGIPSYGAAVFRQDDDQLREAYNKELQKLKDSGKLLEILQKNGFGEENLPGDMTTAQLCGNSQ
ncbi:MULTISPECIES: ectoine/hydroxyectoine ABC transporter substrate-binding protein EhuB [Geobacillus]|jgi:polar amino acid transport system substrate-binding protein|uniref:ectoine/hydroxyectoine ABC transporter substrate-binding protein EhuB n=1 Tax=Geobacillus TaxID=129337 RepID=UPI00042216FB|nr:MULTISPECIES: ectoine/hydroxyectoine ABC transporter substrate-binding protein EhuB [Geobacillus]ARA99226.1 ectoine/hydroxyectoine ABC transporter substrate-binding protein EhuB [Geobacillus thermodenitrificans]KQB92683.1 amino acid ABC transporter substrate-binding protein [Geobacillus sp. PA-3]MED3719107.1 ectoine/hydroxyectoine ABC transporter substrate-binding protein EhuB [Geobacillus thermodenitrificans]MED3906935.1 ectoine/hydroxyectoine ABC transporter substrate-binding protein EhuB 